MSSPIDVVLMPLVGLRQIRYGEIVVVAAFNLVGEAMLHDALGWSSGIVDCRSKR